MCDDDEIRNDEEWEGRCHMCGERMESVNAFKINLDLDAKVMADGKPAKGVVDVFLSRPVCTRCHGHTLSIAVMQICRQLGLWDGKLGD